MSHTYCHTHSAYDCQTCAAFAGRVCNKCGRIHDGGLGGMVGGEQSVPKANQATQERQP